MKSGIYGLASLNARPLDPSDCSVLLAGAELPPVIADGCTLSARDPDRSAISHWSGNGQHAVLLGELDRPEEDARRLGLSKGFSPVELALAAHGRWDVEAVRELSGEWALALWDCSQRTMTLLVSECARDDCYYTVARGRLAIAPSLKRLAQLSWVDDLFDAEGLVRAMGRAHMREGFGGRTFLRGVAKVEPGTQVRISVEGANVERMRPLSPPPLAQITFGDAVERSESIVRGLLRRRMAGRSDVAFLLSGGLDSTLLACLGVFEHGTGQRVHLLSSAAPDGSGIKDETGWARIASDHLGLPLIPVPPSDDADPFFPSAKTFSAKEGPAQSPRHYLYEALEDAALQQGASLLVDGQFGELSISNHGFFRPTPRQMVGNLRRSLLAKTRNLRARDADMADPDFHVRLAPGLAATADRETNKAAETFRPDHKDGPLGYERGWFKALRHATAASDPNIRYYYPFRDPVLLRTAAAFPSSFVVRDGVQRAITRAMLAQHGPRQIAVRDGKMPFSPTFHTLLQTNAGTARARIDEQRAAGADEWLDLDWLARILERIEARDGLSLDQLFAAQATAVAAAFIVWWRTP